MECQHCGVRFAGYDGKELCPACLNSPIIEKCCHCDETREIGYRYSKGPVCWECEQAEYAGEKMGW
jgi:hypothetical protein